MTIIDENQIFALLEKNSSPDNDAIKKILEKAGEKKGLSLTDVSMLLNTEQIEVQPELQTGQTKLQSEQTKLQSEQSELTAEMFKTASKIKKEIYGDRLVFFAPLYVSNYCVNDCSYCGFQRSAPGARTKLSIDEITEQTKILISMGHKRLLLEFGEHPSNDIDYTVDAIQAVYDVKSNGSERGGIRRVNVNLAATTTENYRKLKRAGIGTYQLFQETYHRETYSKLHNGPKADYERQLFAHNRAIQAGIDDVGIGVLFGLYNYKFEVLALISHAQYLDKEFGVGPHTISVPRWQPAESVNWKQAPHQVSEEELLKAVAILRMAVPYTGIIMSTRERPEIRARAFELGVSQTSAASRTCPGGYKQNETRDTSISHGLSQFSTADSRNADEVIQSVLKQGLLPSFCTACYRKGRTGETFMHLAKTGEIQNLCTPNALLTFQEYLEDYASPRVKELGVRTIAGHLGQINDEKMKGATLQRLERIKNGERDLYF